MKDFFGSLFVIIIHMDNGISFDEACEQTPNGLTEQQLQNCPGHDSFTLNYVYAGVVLFIVVIILAVFLTFKSKSSKKSL